MAGMKTIAVIGATGAQGGGLVRAILADREGPFAVRAITRNGGSDRATELSRLGAEVVVADLDDADSLERAFRGAHGAYCVTNFWEHYSPARELSQAENLAEAAGRAGVEHVIWSTLEDTRKWVPLDDDRMPTLMDRYKVPHFDAKGEADAAFSRRGLPVTFLLTSFYWENLIQLGSGPKPDADGVLALTLPMGNRKLPGVAAEDIGRCAYGVFREGEKYLEQTVGVAGEHLTGEGMARALTKALDAKVRYNAVSPAEYRAFGFPGAEDLGNMFQFKRDFNDYFCGARDPAKARRVNPSLLDFEAWLARYKDRIPRS